jgi:hypothetical protein
MLRQRVFGGRSDWKDLNEHGAPCQDVAMQAAMVVDREVASASELCRPEKWPTAPPHGARTRCRSTNSLTASRLGLRGDGEPCAQGTMAPVI